MPPTIVRVIRQPCCLVIVSPSSVGGDDLPQSVHVNSSALFAISLWTDEGHDFRS
jgi:hypothetical protein